MAIDAQGYTDPEPGSCGYNVVGGVAVIPVLGTLVQNLGSIHSWGFVTGYDGIRINFLHALADPDVDAIVLNVNSGGGDCAGLFDLVDMIYESRSIKPTLAICSEVAYSAAYALGSACEQVTVPRTGGTGSVGVIAAHTEYSRAYNKAGIEVTLIHYGARKADGADTEPLSGPARTRYQSDVDIMGKLFCKTVARNRGLSVKTVRDTQATTFLGAAGVEIGFADAVMAPDEAFRSLLAELG
jgi:ClpP class serine protease